MMSPIKLSSAESQDNTTYTSNVLHLVMTVIRIMITLDLLSMCTPHSHLPGTPSVSSRTNIAKEKRHTEPTITCQENIQHLLCPVKRNKINSRNSYGHVKVLGIKLVSIYIHVSSLGHNITKSVIIERLGT